MTDLLISHQLISRLQQREESALIELYDQHGMRVYSLIMSILNDRMSAEEVTQDTFMRIWIQIHMYRHEQNRFLGWMLTMARNLAINRLLQENRVNNNLFSIDDNDFIEPPDVHFDNEQRWREMQLLLTNIPKEQREVIILAEYHGMSQTEISEYLCVPLGTIKTRQRLGMEKLRIVWEKTKV